MEQKYKLDKDEHLIFFLEEGFVVKALSPNGLRFFNTEEVPEGKNFFQLLEGSPFRRLIQFKQGLEDGHSFFNARVRVPEVPPQHFLFSAVVSPDRSCAIVCLRPETLEYIAPAILMSIADGVFVVDENWRIVEFNRAAEQMTGWKRQEVLGKACRDVFKTSICSKNCALARAIKEKRAISDQRVFVRTRDGRSLPISISVSPVIDEDGEVRGGIETFRDITKQVEREIILDSVADGVFTVDRHWKITSFNRAAEEITGYPAQKAIGMTCREVFQSSLCGEACPMAQSMRMGRQVGNTRVNIKRIDGQSVPISISTAPLLDADGNIIGGVETFRDLREIDSLRKELTGRYTMGDIISKSPQMQKIFDILPEIAMSDSNVLILGESGTGKELVARAVHNFSRRRRGPFVAVNCGALPDTLLESELFGYKKGAFTDAKQDKEGRFAAAEGGTLFLDEIGDISPALQVKLLRVLQDKAYTPLGANKPVKADVRIIAATNRDLEKAVKEGRFREDLYYRLNVVKISLPSLRERISDVPLLIEHFIQKFNVQKGKDVSGISEEALARLMRYDFPGNVRELENIIEYAFILCHGGLITVEHLPEPFCLDEPVRSEGALHFDRPMSMKEIEREAIIQALRRNQGKRMATCRELGISKDTLRRKIKEYAIDVKAVV